MIDHPNCPVCASGSFVDIGSKTFSRNDASANSSYVGPRLEVLFEIWFRGQASVTLTYKACEECGFVFYTPRPDAADLSAKYAYFTKHRIGAHHDQSDASTAGKTSGFAAAASNSAFELERARRLRADVLKFARTATPMRILDFGGGDGRLMSGLVSDGHSCFLVDYSTHVVPGVTKLGDTTDDLRKDEQFDLIICSHVVEHVAEPRDLLTELAKRLSPSGALFVEVPMEIWSRPPIQPEPVTHVNFFTPASMSRLLFESGLKQLSCRLSSYLTPHGQERLAIKALACIGRDKHLAPPRGEGLKQTHALLSPGLAQRAWRFSAAHRQLLPAVAAKLRRA